MSHRYLTALLLSLAATLPTQGQGAASTLSLPPVMGWSSWNTFHVNISEELIKQQAETMVASGLAEKGYTYINVDDGYFGQRDETGMMHAHPERFPNGMKTVADHIHSLGLRAGIYSDAGDVTCASIYDNDTNGVGAGLYGHEQQDLHLYLKDWNFDFIKIDYCGAERLNLDEQTQYTHICNTIKSIGRQDVSINICRWAFPGTWATQIAHSWRISPDIRPHWLSIKHIIEKNLYLSAYAGKGHYNDMDMLEIGCGLTPEEEELHFGIWCIMSSPLLIGCDMTTIPEASLDLLKNEELIAINQDTLGLQAHVAWRNGDCYVLVKDIEQLHSTTRAVAILNMSDSTGQFDIPLHLLQLGGETKVRDLIHHRNLETVWQTFHYTLPPHTTLILRLEAQERLEAQWYEAEQAFLSFYNDLGGQQGQATYAQAENCSGGVKVINLGGKDNTACWNDVYSHNGGTYEITIYLQNALERVLTVWVNGTPTTPTIPSAPIATCTFVIHLKPGSNTIEMGNPFGPAPDIDAFSLKFISPNF